MHQKPKMTVFNPITAISTAVPLQAKVWSTLPMWQSCWMWSLVTSKLIWRNFRVRKRNIIN